jgi:hypothetical protein
VLILLGIFFPIMLSLVGCSQERASEIPSGSQINESIEPVTVDTPTILDESQWPDRVAARHILIPFTGATGVPLGTTSDREEALAIASSIYQALLDGADMAELARIHSSDSTSGRGGFLGGAERGTWTEAFERSAFSLEVGEISPPVESPYGFHIIRREALEEVRLMHIVIQHADSRVQWQDTPDATRTLEEARTLANEAAARIETGEAFEALAAELSDGPNGIRGADLGWFLRGEISPNFDDAVFALEIGDTTAPIETPWGFHLVKRIE